MYRVKCGVRKERVLITRAVNACNLLVKKLDLCSRVIGNFWHDYHKSFNGNDCLMRSTILIKH